MFKFLNRLLTTGFFIGNLPGAPGTYGSLLGAFFIVICRNLNALWYMAIILFIVGLMTTSCEEKFTGIKDDPRIVIDEITGMFVTFIGIPFSWTNLTIGFVLFRIFDISKPQPIKIVQKLDGGWGIMIDDLLAGIAAHIGLRLLLKLIF